MQCFFFYHIGNTESKPTWFNAVCSQKVHDKLASWKQFGNKNHRLERIESARLFLDHLNHRDWYLLTHGSKNFLIKAVCSKTRFLFYLQNSPRPISRFGAKSKLGGGLSRENTLISRGNTFMETNLLQPPMLAVTGHQKSTMKLNGGLNGFSNPKAKIAPMEASPQIHIEVS